MKSTLTPEQTSPIELSFIGATFKTSAPASAEAYDQLVGPGAALAAALQHAKYHGYANPFRAKLAKEIELVTGVKPAVIKTVKGRGGNDVEVFETEKSYVERLQKDGTLKISQLNAAAAKVESEFSLCDFLAASNVAGTGRISQENLELAEGLIAAWAEGTKNPQDFIDKVVSICPQYADLVIGEEPTVGEIAPIVKIYRTTLAAQAL